MGNQRKRGRDRTHGWQVRYAYHLRVLSVSFACPPFCFTGTAPNAAYSGRYCGSSLQAVTHISLPVLQPPCHKYHIWPGTVLWPAPLLCLVSARDGILNTQIPHIFVACSPSISLFYYSVLHCHFPSISNMLSCSNINTKF